MNRQEIIILYLKSNFINSIMNKTNIIYALLISDDQGTAIQASITPLSSNGGFMDARGQQLVPRKKPEFLYSLKEGEQEFFTTLLHDRTDHETFILIWGEQAQTNGQPDDKAKVKK